MGSIFPVLPRCAPTRRRVLATALAAASGASLSPSVIRPACADTVVRLGQIEALTGPSSPAGIRGRDGALMAAEDINNAGGIAGKFKLEVAAQDMANDPKQAVTLFRQFATDNSVVASIGPTNSVGFVPIVPIAGQVGVPVVGEGSGAPLKQWNPWVYRVNPVAASAVPVVLKQLVPKLGIKRMAVLYDQTQDGQVGDAEICKKMEGELGYQVVAYEAFRAGDQDVSPQLATIRTAKPDMIYCAAAPGDAARIVLQIKERGFDQPLVTGYGTFQDTVVWDGTKGQVKGGYTWIGQDLSSPNAQVKAFLERYNKRFPQEATSFSIYGSDAVYTVAEAISRAGSIDRAKIKEALSDLQYTTPLGTQVKFKNPPEGDNLTPGVVVIQITGRGSYVAV
jgi:branched-chain amino acid transport system substrate-binding protein